MSGQGSAGNVLAAICSFFLPGLGQLVQGRVGRALAHFLLSCVLWCMMLGWVMMIISAIDAAMFQPPTYGAPHGGSGGYGGVGPDGEPLGAGGMGGAGGMHAGYHPPSYAPGGSGSAVLKAGVGCLALGFGSLMTLFAVAVGVAMIDQMGWEFPSFSGDDDTEEVVQLDPQQRLDQQIQRFTEQRERIEQQLATDLPKFREQQQQQADKVRREISGASPSRKVLLEDEAKEIARLLVALDKEEIALRETRSRLDQEIRRLERLRGSQDLLSTDNEKLMAELDESWSRTGAAIDQPLKSRLGTGAIEDLAVQKRARELLGESQE